MHEAGDQHLKYPLTGCKNQLLFAQTAWCFPTHQGWGWELCVGEPQRQVGVGSYVFAEPQSWREAMGEDAAVWMLWPTPSSSFPELSKTLWSLKNVVHQWRDALLRKIRLLESFPHTDNQYVLPCRGCIFVKFSIKSSALFHLWASMMVLSRNARGKRWYHQEGGLQPCH